MEHAVVSRRASMTYSVAPVGRGCIWYSLHAGVLPLGEPAHISRGAKCTDDYFQGLMFGRRKHPPHDLRCIP